MDHHSSPSMGSRIPELRSGVLPAAIAGCGLGLVAISRSGGGEGAQVAAGFAVLALGIAVFWGMHRVRAAKAHRVGAFGSSSSQHVDDLRTVPRFAASIEQMRRLDGTKGWIGGGLNVGPDGIRWEPSGFSRRFSRVPVMDVDWSEVCQVRTEAISGIGNPAGLYVDLDDGSTWTLNASRLQSLIEALDRYGPSR